MTIVYLIRHGDTDAGEKISGRREGMHLSARGREQAEALARRLASVPFSAVFSSPLERTRETALPLARRHRLDVAVIEDLYEIEFGDWTGMTFEALESVHKWKIFHIFRGGTRIPGGEMMVEVQSRMVTSVERLCSEFSDRTIALFSHGDPIRSVICHYAGIPLDFMLRLSIDTASVSVLSIGDYGAELLGMNHTGEAPRG